MATGILSCLIVIKDKQECLLPLHMDRILC